MNWGVFTVKDTVSGHCIDPFVVRTTAEAIRGFATGVNTEGTRLATYPEDHVLYKIGEWDPVEGSLTSHEPIKVSNATDHITPFGNHITLEKQEGAS